METVDMSKITIYPGGELFDVTDEFEFKVRDICDRADNVRELKDTLLALEMTPDERDFAMFMFGRKVNMNNLVNDPRLLVKEMILQDPMVLVAAAIHDPSILGRLRDL